MRSFREIVALELKAFVRTKAFALLIFAAVSWMLVLPRIIRGDGTLDGARELAIRYSLGGVFVLVMIALLASATGSLAGERTARRLQLTMVRPVHATALVLGKALAHVLVGAAVLAVAGVILLASVQSRPCLHVLSPILPPAAEEAKIMYEAYMRDTNTPEAVRLARREDVLRILENRAFDRYEAIPTNAVASWRFDGADGEIPVVRMRFTNRFSMRDEVCGTFRLGSLGATLTNITQAVLVVPLEPLAADEDERGADDATLRFYNGGRSSLMVRPRRDVNLLLPADGFAWNLLRSYLVLVAILALTVSVGLFLSAGLGRPVALFSALTLLLVSELAPSVQENHVAPLEASAVDRLGLEVTRLVTAVTRPVSALSPLEALSKDECVELSDVLRLLTIDLVLTPLVLALFAALVLPRKSETT